MFGKTCTRQGPRVKGARTRDGLGLSRSAVGERRGRCGERRDVRGGEMGPRGEGSGAIDPTSVTMATVPNKSSATLQPPARRRRNPALVQSPSKAACSEFSRLKRPGNGIGARGRVRSGRGRREWFYLPKTYRRARATVLAAVDCAKTHRVRQRSCSVHPLSCRVCHDRKSPTTDGASVLS